MFDDPKPEDKIDITVGEFTKWAYLEEMAREFIASWPKDGSGSWPLVRLARALEELDTELKKRGKR